MNKNRQKKASQWFQAIISLGVLSCIYIAKGYFPNEVPSAPQPHTPPLEIQQNAYWNGDTTGFSWVKAEAIDTGKNISAYQELLYDKGGIKISLFRDMSSDQIEQLIQSELPRFYTPEDRGTLLIEGDISSPQIADIIAQLQST
ncbi:hypothetical protein CSB09_02425 [Candidatus Gracilibacteria bacterium]|nr:MAG: hypothetical protein CSB09_02425 [Candidatus Gracilibacteria bacterium]